MEDVLGLITRIAKENQHFFINNVEVSGIQNVEAQYEISHRPLKFLGMGNTIPKLIAQGTQGGNVSVNALLITQDQFIGLTGNSGFNGYIMENTGSLSGNFSFSSGYLTSYNSTCSIGQIPEIAANISVFGNIGKFLSNESSKTQNDFNLIQSGEAGTSLTIAAPGCIVLDLDDFETNRVLSYDLQINVPRLPIYALGKKEPVNVEISWPIEVTCSFQFDVFNYQAHTIKKFFCSPKTQDVGITLKSFDTNQTIQSFNFTGMTLISEAYSTNVDNNVRISARYKSYLMGAS